jgi:hypothetical protein
VRLIRTTPLLRGLFVVIAIGALADSLNTPLIAPFVLNVVGAGAAAIGLIFTVAGLVALIYLRRVVSPHSATGDRATAV